MPYWRCSRPSIPTIGDPEQAGARGHTRAGLAPAVRRVPTSGGLRDQPARLIRWSPVTAGPSRPPGCRELPPADAMRARPRRPLVCSAVLGLMLAGLLAGAGCQRTDKAAEAPKAAPAAVPTFVGSANARAATGGGGSLPRSDHARAMQPATEQTVLGNFDQARVSHRGGTSTFSAGDGNFRAHRRPRRQARRVRDHLHLRRHPPPAIPRAIPRRAAPGARPGLGHAAPRGRRPALVPALSRRHAAPPGSAPLDGRDQTWNFQCAECHSTDLRKHYDLASNRYATTWAAVADARLVEVAENRLLGGRLHRPSVIGLGNFDQARDHVGHSHEAEAAV